MSAKLERSVRNRFGGAWNWKLAKGRTLVIAEAIQGEGPGDGPSKGFALCPWVLDKYERVLRLRPFDTWLLKRFLKHAWEFGADVFLSLRRITREADVSRPTVQAAMRRLEELHYLRLVSEGGGWDRRRRYDVSGVFGALALCIAADPTSEWSTANGGCLSESEVKGLNFTGPRFKEGLTFDLDFVALRKLAEGTGCGGGGQTS